MPSIQESAREQLSGFLELRRTIESLNRLDGHGFPGEHDDFDAMSPWSRPQKALSDLEEELYHLKDKLPTLCQKIRESLLLPDPTQSARIEFLGSEDFSPGGDVIVSFPGVHGLAWTMLTTKGLKYPRGERSSPPRNDVIGSFRGVDGLAIFGWGMSTTQGLGGRPLTSCIFLPDASCKGYGKHMEDAFETGKCWCYKLYGERKDHGCKWYDLWMAKTRKAADAGSNLILVTKEGGGLGNSQEGEKKFLEAELRYPFKEIDINAFANLVIPDADFRWFLEENAKKLMEILSGPSTSKKANLVGDDIQWIYEGGIYEEFGILSLPSTSKK
eukprot:Skav236068  [mRNA]  locus=scaffold2211:101357:102343:- [translate_table: standard]